MCTLWGREITEVAQTEKTPNLTHSVRNEKSYFYIFYPLASLTTFFNEVEKLYVMRSRSLFTEVGEIGEIREIGLLMIPSILKQSVISQESALEATQAGFEVGTRTIVDVLQSTRALFQARSSLADARYDYVLAILQL